MITVTEKRSESYCNDDFRERTIEIRFLGILIYKKFIKRGN